MDKEIPQQARVRAEMLISVLGSKTPTPNPNPDPELRKKNPWLPGKHGQLVRSQLFKLRTRPQDIGLENAPFSGPEASNPTEWWEQYGGDCRELQAVALRCFPPASAAGGERVFSALANQWTKKRSTMSMSKASMLAYIFFNGRAMQREEMPRQDWDAFYESLADEEAQEAVDAEVVVEEEAEGTP